MSDLVVRPLRYAGRCSQCGTSLPPGARATWNRDRKEATCELCVSGENGSAVDRGRPGASAAREGARRRQHREERINAAHPRVGKAILALTGDPQSTRAWAKGAAGERALGEALEALREEGFGVLHDRRIPGTRANIDHLVVGPAGIFVIDAKSYTGKVERRDRGWLLARDWRLYVRGRDHTSLVEGMARQVQAVRAAVAGSEFSGCRVVPVLCFVGSQWNLIASPFLFGDVRVVWSKMLGELVETAGELGCEQVRALETLLAGKLPAA